MFRHFVCNRFLRCMRCSTRVSDTTYASLLCLYLPFYGIARSVLARILFEGLQRGNPRLYPYYFLSFISFKKYVFRNELRGANRRFLSLRRNALCDCGNPRFYPYYCLPPFPFPPSARLPR